MALVITLPLELEKRVRQESQRQNISETDYTIRVLEEFVPISEKNRKLMELLQSWIDSDDKTEFQETGDYLIQALDEDRLSDRKLFPEELKGITW